MNPDVPSIVRRVVARVTAGREPSPVGLPPAWPVATSPAPGAPGPSPAAGGAPLVCAECLLDTPEGGTFHVPSGARITPLAREEAWRRNITLAGDGAGGGSQ